MPLPFRYDFYDSPHPPKEAKNSGLPAVPWSASRTHHKTQIFTMVTYCPLVWELQGQCDYCSKGTIEGLCYANILQQ